MNPFIPAAVQQLLSKPVAFYQENQSEAPSGKAPLTNIALVLDCSGSMSHGKEATIEGFNTQVDAIRTGAVDAGATTYTDVQFSTEVNIRGVAVDLDNLVPLNASTYVPNGNTALLDAIGSTIAALLQTPDIHSTDTATLVTTFTDGQENASRIYSAATIKAMVERLEATGRWTFALIGPKRTVSQLAEMLAVKRSNVAGYDESSIADKSMAFKRVAMANESVFFSRKAGSKQFVDLYESTSPEA
jgi:hypothetical protein